ncbi:acyltransferase family protein [Rhodococcus sp. 077-4]|uniref:acyltransferase family protein n=1 Tax=Rhodococcus sp. 077-4 TaxID=2789271 RepID=UPI0039F5C487
MSSNKEPLGRTTDADADDRSPQRVTLHGLAAIRLIPSFIIVVSHFSFLHLTSNVAADSILFTVVNPAGCNAVSFFMILSGFILAWITSQPDTLVFRNFLVKRLLRVWPVHVVASILALALLWKLDWAIPVNLFLLHAWIPDPNAYYSLNAPSWTLCTELVLYLIFPKLIGRLSRASSAKLGTLLSTLVATVILIPALLTLFPDGGRIGNVAFVEHMQPVEISSWKYWFVYIFPLTRLLECIIGVIVCILVRRGIWPRSILLACSVLALAVVLEVTTLPYLFSLTSATVLPITLLIGAVATREIATDRVPHIVKKLSVIGKYTFGIYMYQWILILLFETAFTPQSMGAAESFALIPLFYLFALALSYFSYGTLEKYVREKTKEFLRKQSEHARRTV